MKHDMQTEAMQIFRLIFVNTALAGNLSGIIVLCKLNIYYFNNHPPLSLPPPLSPFNSQFLLLFSSPTSSSCLFRSWPPQNYLLFYSALISLHSFFAILYSLSSTLPFQRPFHRENWSNFNISK